MKLKSYFADGVEAAMEMASKELGSEAMLVYSRQASPEARHLGAYEVVFGVGDPGAEEAGESAQKQTAPFQADAGRTSPENPAELQRLTDELGDLKRLVGRLAGSVTRANIAQPDPGPLSEPLAEITDSLLETGIGDEAVHELLTSLRRSPELQGLPSSPASLLAMRKMIRNELLSRVLTDSRIGTSSGGAASVALIGPAGAGKTTALVKMAARHSLHTQKPVQILSADTYRVGAAEQLRSYAAILGIGFQVFDTAGGLAQALEEHRHKDLVLIDTPGFGTHDLDAGDELAVFLRARPEIDVHLTLSATTKLEDVQKTTARFARFRPTKLLFTRLDETLSPASIVAEALRTRFPVSYLTSGQLIPEDIEAATPERLADLVVGDQRAATSIETADTERSDHWQVPVADHAAAA
jgi:flagellar biosynthesis protein FlhF